MYNINKSQGLYFHLLKGEEENLKTCKWRLYNHHMDYTELLSSQA